MYLYKFFQIFEEFFIVNWQFVIFIFDMVMLHLVSKAHTQRVVSCIVVAITHQKEAIFSWAKKLFSLWTGYLTMVPSRQETRGTMHTCDKLRVQYQFLCATGNPFLFHSQNKSTSQSWYYCVQMAGNVLSKAISFLSFLIKASLMECRTNQIKDPKTIKTTLKIKCFQKEMSWCLYSNKKNRSPKTENHTQLFETLKKAVYVANARNITFILQIVRHCQIESHFNHNRTLPRQLFKKKKKGKKQKKTPEDGQIQCRLSSHLWRLPTRKQITPFRDHIHTHTHTDTQILVLKLLRWLESELLL